MYSKSDHNDPSNSEYNSQLYSNQHSDTLDSATFQPNDAYTNVDAYSEVSDSFSQQWQAVYLQEVQQSLQKGLTKFPTLEVQSISWILFMLVFTLVIVIFLMIVHCLGLIICQNYLSRIHI